MIKYSWLVLSLFVLSFQVEAQNKVMSLEDAVLKGRTVLAPERLSQLQWIPKSNTLAYVAKRQGKEVMVTLAIPSLNRDTILEIHELSNAFLNLLPKATALTRFPFLTWTSLSTFRFYYTNAHYEFNLSNKKVSLLAKASKDGENLDFDAVSNKLAYTLYNNLYVNVNGQSSPEMGADAQGQAVNKGDLITDDAQSQTSYGKSVHRNEFGITKGTFFSPKGNRIAYYKLSESMVDEYPLMKINSTDTNGSALLKPTATEILKYPMAGNKSHQVRLYLYDFNKKRKLEVMTTGDPEQYLTNVSWSPDEEYLYIAILNRNQNEMQLQQFDGTTGQFIRTLFTEKHNKYVEPQKAMYFLNDDGSKFIWFSQKDGFTHLYLYNARGNEIKPLTTGKITVKDIIGNDPKGLLLFYHAVSEDGMSKYIYKLDLKTGINTIINKLEGQHMGLVSDDGQFIIDQLSSVNIPRRYLIMDNKGKEIGTLFNAINPIREYQTCDIKLGQINSTDNTVKLNYRMILPTAFDSTKKYPVLVYVYGGPHAQMINNSWLGNADLWLYYMAQKGHIVFTLDNRGSMNRGIDFENATFRNLGKYEMEDQLAGVNFLKKFKYVDATRMGVYGWSFGGFMSTSLMTKTPDVFKVGVAGGPVIDWRLYEIMYTERYMDMPQDNAAGYKEADLTNYAKNLKGRLMLIHGTNDNVVLWQHTLTYLKKCVDEGVLVDYFVYPGHEHNVLGPDRLHLMKKITQYFKDFL
jgi:dipeptidyl-peptidase-4